MEYRPFVEVLREMITDRYEKDMNEALLKLQSIEQEVGYPPTVAIGLAKQLIQANSKYYQNEVLTLSRN